MLSDDLSCILVALVDDIMYFLVDLLGNFLAVASGMCQISSDKYLITVITMASYIIGHCMEAGCFEMPRGVSPHGMTMAFLTMSMCEIFHSFNMRSQRRSVFTLRGHNKVLWAAMLGSLVLTTVVLEVPPIANAFGFTPVSWTEYGIALALAVLVIPVVELVKLIQRRLGK